MPSLSQTYRPHHFSDITGQQHVTETLRQEVASGRLAHAYLFSGPRGVGKTTAARIFAMALNCREPQNGEPCLTCETCQAAQAGRLMDVIELDAATHTGVDTVREAIIEHVRFAPTQGVRKVYILDEVHMFSTASWNALLKTLEEPPSYAFFILATTELHKVPATIVSRCQRFEFRRVSDEALLERLRQLVMSEGWKATDEALRMIVSRASGCVRDAETLLGQVGALGQAEIDADAVGMVIPASHLPVAAELLLCWAERDPIRAWQTVQRVSDEGLPLVPLFDDLLEIVRRLLSASADPKCVERWRQGTEEDRSLVPLTERLTPLELNDAALLLLERRRDVKSGVDPLFALQLVGTIISNGALRHSTSAPSTPTVDRFPSVREEKAERGQSDEPSPVMQVQTVEQPVVTVPAPELSVEEVPVSPVMSSPVIQRVAESVVQPDAEGSVELNEVRAKWPAVIKYVDEKNHALPFILKISQPERVEGVTVILRFQYAFHRDKIISDPKHRKIVEEGLRTVLGNPKIMLDGIIGEDAVRTEERQHDMVSNVLRAFGGSVVES